MSDRKHKPGPCRWNGNEIVDAAGTAIAGIAPGQPDEYGPLFAAAPEMLEALELHTAYEARLQDRGGKNGPKGRARAKWLAARDAALAKALKGETT